MIIVACTDDDSIFEQAEKQSGSEPAIYGATYKVFDDAIPMLGKSENLFVTAHGAKDGDEDQPVIGDAAKAFWVSGKELWLNAKGIFPVGYSGDVFISACESADRNKNSSFSFTQEFKGLSGLPEVYGQRGPVGLEVPPPDDLQWVKA